MKKHLKPAATRMVSQRRLNLFSWRWREAFVGLGLITFLGTTATPSHAVQITSIGFTDAIIPCELGCTPNTVTVNYTIDTPGQVQLDVFKVQNALDVGTKVASFFSPQTTSGAKSFNWSALWLINGAFGRQDGLYQFEITLSTTAGSTTVRSGGLVQLNSVDIHNTQVAPSFDASGQPTFPYKITYALAKKANVSVAIYNSTGSLARTLLTNQLEVDETISTQTITWDGLDNNTRPVPIGIYTATINAIDPTNNSTAITSTQTIAVTSLSGTVTDPRQIFESNAYIYPNPIRDGQGTFHYEAVRDGAIITLRIYTLTGTLVLDKNFGGVPTGSVQTFDWNATNQSGNGVGRGLYFYVLRESDSQGTLQITKKFAVIK